MSSETLLIVAAVIPILAGITSTFVTIRARGLAKMESQAKQQANEQASAEKLKDIQNQSDEKLEKSRQESDAKFQSLQIELTNRLAEADRKIDQTLQKTSNGKPSTADEHRLENLRNELGSWATGISGRIEEAKQARLLAERAKLLERDKAWFAQRQIWSKITPQVFQRTLEVAEVALQTYAKEIGSNYERNGPPLPADTYVDKRENFWKNQLIIEKKFEWVVRAGSYGPFQPRIDFVAHRLDEAGGGSPAEFQILSIDLSQNKEALISGQALAGAKLAIPQGQARIVPLQKFDEEIVTYIKTALENYLLNGLQ